MVVIIPITKKKENSNNNGSILWCLRFGCLLILLCLMEKVQGLGLVEMAFRSYQGQGSELVRVWSLGVWVSGRVLSHKVCKGFVPCCWIF